ncbi:extracellular solute-binding protein [Paenibacillus ginsengarvi]|uniref:Extracellular solute-binding protein n=1 Tax=Paenibacillus ginsengarvi TaxID=400777 RepID=A0A3B0CHI0_9BACL|nr:extracellular solute-binding protein [Paenibacillus ginsengarvi]RKN83767.1 extracellular solute-binding protein [Paenibacillus ginsengarvi]
MKTYQPKTTPKTRLHRMVTTLRDEIDTGKRKQGEFIPSELNLCEQFELSRSSVRKGLETLVAEGYIVKVERVGTKVLGRPRTDAITLVFGIYSSLLDEVNLQELVNDFQLEYPNIRIEMVDHLFPNNRPAIISHTQAKGIDVLLTNAYHFETMEGAVQEASMLAPLERKEGIYPFLSSHFTKNGALLVQPFLFSPVILCYNKDHFREKGLSEPDSSWTWEEVRQAGKRLSNGSDRYGLYFHVLSDNRWPLFLLQNGVKFRKNGQGTYQLDDPNIKESLQYCMSLMNDRELFPAYLSESNTDVEALFLKQNVSMIVVTYNSLNALRGASFAYDIAPLPYYREPKTLLSVIGLAINRESKQQTAAKLFIDYMTSPKAQLSIRKQTLNIPALRSAAEWTGEEPIAGRPSRFHLFREIMPTFRFFTELGIPFSQFSIMRDELKFYWAGLDSLDNVLMQIEDKLT